MNKKKVCLVTNWYPSKENPYQGLFFREQAIALADNFDFTVLHYQHTTKVFNGKSTLTLVNEERNITEYQAKIVASRMQGKIRRIFLGDKHYTKHVYCEFMKLLGNEHIDVFYSVTAQSEAIVCAALAKAAGKPYVLAEHAPFPWPNTVITNEKREAIEGAAGFLAISHDKVRQILMQDIKLPQIHYVGNMVDDDLFTFEKAHNEIKTFVAVGANSFYKNYPMLIETFNRLTEITDVPFRLMIVGFQANKGYSKDSTELEQALLESKFAKSLELVPNVPHEEMNKVYAKADAFVMTSIQEGQPVSAIEAGCCGLPIFSTRCGGVEDYVTDDVGRVVDVLDSTSLSGYLKDFLENKISFDSVKIREVVKARFGKEAFVQAMTSALASV